MRGAVVLAACLSYALLACRSQNDSGSGIDVYVPSGGDGGDAGAPADASEESFGLGPVDRAGRPLVSVLLVPVTLQDEYNAQPTFAPVQPRPVQDAIESRLVQLDTLTIGDAGPDPVDWPVPEGGTHPLLPVLLGDTLIVDTTLPCTSADGGFATSYLDVEREVFLGGPPHSTCGGRTPNEPVVDETLQLLVTGDRDGGPPLAQGVAGPTKPATTSFPYLAPPN